MKIPGIVNNEFGRTSIHCFHRVVGVTWRFISSVVKTALEDQLIQEMNSNCKNR